MTLQELTGNASWVALAGGAALVAAGWRQVLGLFTYLRSFLIVEYTFNVYLNWPITRYLRTNWTYVPMGKFWVIAVRTNHQTLKINFDVPFKHPMSPVLYRNGLNFINFKGGAGGPVTITCARWFDMDAFLKKALDAKIALDVADAADKVRNSRFVVYDVIGRDKSDMRSSGRGNASDSGGSLSKSSEPVSSQSRDDVEPWAMLDIDRSSLYDPETYTHKKTDVVTGTEFLPKSALAILEETQTWFERRDWFHERSIPWRRGIMLVGPGGAGKSTYAMILARRLGVPLYRFHLNTLSDSEFVREINNTVGLPAVILFEDFDRVFKGRDSVKNQYLSFDTVINIMSGVQSLDGAIFVITTNKPEDIDPAIGVSVAGSSMSSRPGRIDRILEMGEMETPQRHLLIERILGDWPDLLEEAKFLTKGYTIVQTQEHCVQQALHRIH